MYLNTETQARILDRFHFALHERGFLFLGKAETLLTYNNAFIPVDLKRRIFAKVARGNLRERLLDMARTGSEEAVNHLVGHVRVRESAFEPAPSPRSSSTSAARWRWPTTGRGPCSTSGPADLSRPLQDLQISYRPADLRSVHRPRLHRAPRDRAQGRRMARRPQRRQPLPRSPRRPADGRRRHRYWAPASPSSTPPPPGGSPTSTSGPPASWRPPTRSSSRPTRSSRPPTRSSSRPSRSSRPPARSSSRPTRSSRR